MAVVAHIYNPSTWEAEAGRLRVGGQLRLYSKTLSQTKTKTRKDRGIFLIKSTP
jgi:hypothetical protein